MLLSAALLPAVIASATPPGETWNPLADEAATVRCGEARFTVLTPRLLRMEWSADGRFEDRATLTFVNRRLNVPAFKVERKGKGCVIDTGALKLEYAGGRFSAATLKIGDWCFGKSDDGNLLGTTRTLDGVGSLGDLMPQMGKGIVSRDGWAVIDDSTNHVFTVDGGSEWVAAREPGERLDLYYFGYGHDYQAALGDYVKVAGRIALPPRWSFGYWWSRYWLYSDREVRELVLSMRSHDIPMDVMILDMDWHDTYDFGREGWLCTNIVEGGVVGWTGYTWNRQLFPDPAGLMKWLHDRSLKVGANLHPANGIDPREAGYAAFKRDYGYDAEGSIPFRHTDQKWTSAYFKNILMPIEAQGMDFWWLDWQQWPTDREVPGLSNTFWLNYLFARHQGERAGGREREFIYHRWGGLGSHRYQVGFSGDTGVVWGALRLIPYFTATAANVGYGYWGHDIGGHCFWNATEAGDNELYLRWLQSGVFTPIFKIHTTKDPRIDRRMWMHPEYYDAMREAIRLRYRLAAYLYTAARTAWETGVSPCRPLYYVSPEEPAAYDRTASNYLFGDDILACTITEKADSTNGLAHVGWYFPAGRWYDVDAGGFVEGGRSNEFSRTLAENAWFVRSGSIIPMYPDELKSLQEADGSRMVLSVYPGAESGAGELYEDAGDTSSYPTEFAKTRFRQSTDAYGVLRLDIGAREGGYPRAPLSRDWTVRLVNRLPPAKVMFDGLPVDWEYDGDEFTPVVTLRNVSAAAHQLTVVWSDAALENEHRLAGVRGFVSRAAALCEGMKMAEAGCNSYANPPDEYLGLANFGSKLAACGGDYGALFDEYDRARADFPAIFAERSKKFAADFCAKVRAQLGF